MLLLVSVWSIDLLGCAWWDGYDSCISVERRVVIVYNQGKYLEFLLASLCNWSERSCDRVDLGSFTSLGLILGGINDY